MTWLAGLLLKSCAGVRLDLLCIRPSQFCHLRLPRVVASTFHIANTRFWEAALLPIAAVVVIAYSSCLDLWIGQFVSLSWWYAANFFAMRYTIQVLHAPASSAGTTARLSPLSSADVTLLWSFGIAFVEIALYNACPRRPGLAHACGTTLYGLCGCWWLHVGVAPWLSFAQGWRSKKVLKYLLELSSPDRGSSQGAVPERAPAALDSRVDEEFGLDGAPSPEPPSSESLRGSSRTTHFSAVPRAEVSGSWAGHIAFAVAGYALLVAWNLALCGEAPPLSTPSSNLLNSEQETPVETTVSWTAEMLLQEALPPNVSARYNESEPSLSTKLQAPEFLAETRMSSTKPQAQLPQTSKPSLDQSTPAASLLGGQQQETGPERQQPLPEESQAAAGTQAPSSTTTPPSVKTRHGSGSISTGGSGQQRSAKKQPSPTPPEIGQETTAAAEESVSTTRGSHRRLHKAPLSSVPFSRQGHWLQSPRGGRRIEAQVNAHPLPSPAETAMATKAWGGVLLVGAAGVFILLALDTRKSFEFSIPYLICYNVLCFRVPDLLGHAVISALSTAHLYSTPSAAITAISLTYMAAMQAYLFVLSWVCQNMTASTLFPRFLFLAQMYYYLFWYMMLMIMSPGGVEDRNFWVMVVLLNGNYLASNVGLYQWLGACLTCRPVTPDAPLKVLFDSKLAVQDQLADVVSLLTVPAIATSFQVCSSLDVNEYPTGALVVLWQRFGALLIARLLSGLLTEEIFRRRVELLYKADVMELQLLPSEESPNRSRYLSDLCVGPKLALESMRNIERCELYFAAVAVVCTFAVFQRGDIPARYAFVTFGS